MNSPNKRLTVIMPFLNEGDEPLRTIQSIYETANPDDLEIIAIQDGADKHALDDVSNKIAFPAVRFYKKNGYENYEMTMLKKLSE